MTHTEDKQQDLPNANALMNATECLEYEQACIFNEVIEASNQEKVIDQHLQCRQPMLYVLNYIHVLILNTITSYIHIDCTTKAMYVLSTVTTEKICIK